MNMRTILPGLLTAAFFTPSAFALQSENLNLMIPRSVNPKVIDGNMDDWDLRSGVFCCENVLTMRERYASWLYASFDDKNLYVMANWIDGSPMNNPGSVSGDFGFRGDSLQFRLVTQIDNPGAARTCHLMGWKDRNGKDVLQIDYGQKFNEGKVADAKLEGAQQIFTAKADGSGYVQEIAIPWSLISKDDYTPKSGDSILITFEPNFFTEAGFRLSTKDVFKPGVVIDRVFTFQGPGSWGYGKLIDKPTPDARPIRLADGREIPVRIENGQPVVDWSPLYEREEKPGVVPLAFTMEDDGHVSLNIFNKDGQVVRQLLTNEFFTKGEHTISWDGLASPNEKQPGEHLEAGHYTWKALTHKGIGLSLLGWAENAGKTPFDSPGGNWGGDHGKPSAVACSGNNVFLGWSGSEAGKALVCADLNGTVKWRQKHGGFGGAHHLAVDNDMVYVNNPSDKSNDIYRLQIQSGNYVEWNNDATPKSGVINIQPYLDEYAPKHAEGDKIPKLTVNGLAVSGGRMLVSCSGGNRLIAFDGDTGAKLNDCAIDAPSDLEFGPDGRCYVISNRNSVVAIDANLKNPTTLITGLNNASGLALDKDGNIYVGTGEPDHQILVFNATGKQERSIGKVGGRPLLGPWQADGLRFIHALAIDTKGKLWVSENDDTPKRFSRWNAADGVLEEEYFGPTHYGATGGAISPIDPLDMVGAGCEWRLDEKTGKGECLGVISRDLFSTVRYGQSPEGRLYLATGGGFSKMEPVSIFERINAGSWKLRTVLSPTIEEKKIGNRTDRNLVGMEVWADQNDDQVEQAQEKATYTKDLTGWISGWYMVMCQDLSFSGGVYYIAPVSYTTCGAPVYNLDQAPLLPHPDDVAKRGGMGMQRGHHTEGGEFVVYNGHYGTVHSDFICYNTKSGKMVWTYPNTHVGIHGGHKAPPPQTGLIRAAYGPVGSTKLPPPLGNIFIIATDKGEWHILNEEGFYISHLFEGDPSRIQWPDPAAPGAIMDSVPPGMGTEDFGGSMIRTIDGEIYVQHGKTAFINSRVTGLDQVRVLGTGSLDLTKEQVEKAKAIHVALLQEMVGEKKIGAAKKTIQFTNNITNDFGKMAIMEFSKNNATRVKAAIAYDDDNIYLGYEVQDKTPWVNGAKTPERMYAAGDTVDFQLAADANAGKRREAGLGDFRLSIGNFQGTPTAVIYRNKSNTKQPMTFYSGVVTKGYEMDYVGVLPEAKITVKVNNGNYTVEVVLPLKAIDVKVASEFQLNGDFGATHGDEAGDDTVQRTHWNNQSTGLVADEVFELQMSPNNWGQINFE